MQLIDQNDVSPADTAGMDAIFISETVGSGTVVTNLIGPTTDEGAFGNFDLPMITPEVFLFDDMLWMKPGPNYPTDVAHGFAEADAINILPIDHPILGGLRQGPATIYDANPTGEPRNQLGYAVVNGDGVALAGVPGTALFGGIPIPRFPEMRASLFAFEEGDMIHDSDTLSIVANARRVGFFAHTHGGENMNATGQALFRNAVAWALGDEDLIQDITADPYRVLVIYNAGENDEGERDNGSIRDEDHRYLTILADSLGYEVVPIDQAVVSPADTAEVDAIFISESVGSGDVVTNFIAPMTGNAQFANVAKPMVVAEVFVMDDMQWIRHTPVEEFGVDVAWGFANSELLDIQESDHPILGGLGAGEVNVYNAPPANEDLNQVGYAVPHDVTQPDPVAEVLATLGSDATMGDGSPIATFDTVRATLFTYELGDSLIVSDTLTLIARHRRANFFAHTRGSENMNETGEGLFINTMLWATGRDSEVRTIEADGTAAEPGTELPVTFGIASVYPNPFNPTTTAVLQIRESGPYEVNVYDVLGRLVQKVALNISSPGETSLSLDMNGHASGMYLIQLVQSKTGKSAVTRAMLVK